MKPEENLSVHEKGIACEFCSKRFENKKLLSDHIHKMPASRRKDTKPDMKKEKKNTKKDEDDLSSSRGRMR